ncbi:FtsB family cell division protein [Microbacterium elymi]|uniref:Septum formation initiator family protein n=1 Tax=Microbacterium elymi TaxID=2909587 RepID=A0ABY5NK89_9MICO|nr:MULTISPECIES: septum formation initiator family protein [Microbacterium]UUT35587.1 septum formation initiator family protein [Microbacterium elymi]
MAKRPAPLSSASRPAPAREETAAARRRVDVRGWMAGSRLSGFTVIMLGLVVLAVFVLVPTISTAVGQRQQIAALRESVQLTKDEVADLQRQRERYKDPAYITAQARERLYYVKPGEVVYLVDDDLPTSDIPREKAPVSDAVEATDTDWMSQLVRSVAQAGLARTAVGPQDSH